MMSNVNVLLRMDNLLDHDVSFYYCCLNSNPDQLAGT